MASMHDGRSARLSASEERLMALLSSTPLDTAALTKAFYRNRHAPHHARRVMSYLIRSLEDKLEDAKANVRVRRTARAGRQASTVWLERNRG